MKRILIILLTSLAVMTGVISCTGDYNFDKRLSDLESKVSKLEADIASGAVITSVDKTEDGCTFILSNGQSYNVTNGKDGTDGEAIIADVKIEEDFVILSLKNGETLRISYQNPLSMVTLNIVPDYDDGTVRKPETVEVMEMKSNFFYLEIAVTPAKFAEILSDTARFIHKATFTPVQTKGGFGNAFTVSPKSVFYMGGAAIPFLEIYFEFNEQDAFTLGHSPYTVSYSIEDKDGVHGAATPFTVISHDEISEPDVPDNSKIPEGALSGVFTVADPDGKPDSGDERKVYFSRGNLFWDGSEFMFEDNQWNTKPEPSDVDQLGWVINHVSHFYGTSDESSAYIVDPSFSENVVFTNRTETTANPSFSVNVNNEDRTGIWRTLSIQEWKYLLKERSVRKVSDKFPFRNSWQFVKYNNTAGIIIYPDVCSFSELSKNAELSVSDFPEGCVFLPAAGIRDRSDVLYFDMGYYATSSRNRTFNMYALIFYLNGDVSDVPMNNSAISFRLVADCK